MRTYNIVIKKGAEIIHQTSGRAHITGRQITTAAERDPNSGCMLFFFGELYYVSEVSDYRVIREKEAE